MKGGLIFAAIYEMAYIIICEQGLLLYFLLLFKPLSHQQFRLNSVQQSLSEVLTASFDKSSYLSTQTKSFNMSYTQIDNDQKSKNKLQIIKAETVDNESIIDSKRSLNTIF
ncbi:hypothetical protein PPERSA_06767 [Pseudocohnilembus persalinus]|uniref:Transmembrane protein n=1 Tax=Pseudocohnilembus persalinus TaxID=266149 RepID=A0A0V0QSJ8_PSEPJ|nr:hypothetical protein PPERSA_06767 [Pseudocohnilembus persalinus]|eukprot:KRX05133.1 hypothetical protein PPERSA_06767 [Pseudocohnilembus persalinus]